MPKFVLAYKGGAMGRTKKEQQAAMEAWMNWFGALGTSIVDPGAPFGPSSSISSAGRASKGGSSALTGYSIIEAKTMAGATKKAKGCPVLASGGTVEVYEAMPMG